MSTQNHITSRPKFPGPRFPASTENHTVRVSRECQSKLKTIPAAQVNALTCAAERRIRFDGLTKSILAEPDTPTVSLRPYHKGHSFGELGRGRLHSCSSNTARRGRQSFYHFHTMPPCATTYSLRHIHWGQSLPNPSVSPPYTRWMSLVPRSPVHPNFETRAVPFASISNLWSVRVNTFVANGSPATRQALGIGHVKLPPPFHGFAQRPK